MERERPDFLNPNLDFTYLSSGLRSDVFQSGQKVVKIVQQEISSDQAINLARELQAQARILQEAMTPYITPSDHVVGSVNGRPAVVLIQNFIEGTPIKNLLESELRTPHITAFFTKCVSLYEKTGLIPDIFGRPHFLRSWTAPNTSPNIVVTRSENDEIFPYLIDTNFTRRSLNGWKGALHMNLLYRGTKRFLNNLSQSHT